MPTGHLPWMSTDTAGLTRPAPSPYCLPVLLVVATALALSQTSQPRNSLPHLPLLTATRFCLCLPSEMALYLTLLSLLRDTHLELSLSLAQMPADPTWGLLPRSTPHCCSAMVTVLSPRHEVPVQVPARFWPCLSTHTSVHGSDFLPFLAPSCAQYSTVPLLTLLLSS